MKNIIIFLLFINTFELIAQTIDMVNVSLVGTFFDIGYAKYIYVEDNLAYVIGDSSSLNIINVRNPELPSNISSIQTNGDATEVFVSNNYAYISEGISNLLFSIIDIEDPQSPKFVRSMDLSELKYISACSKAAGIFVKSNILYVTHQCDGIQIIDIHSENSPVHIGRILDTGYAGDVIVNGNYLYGTDTHSFYIYDISNVKNPVYIKSYNIYSVYVSDFERYKFDVKGNYAYIANKDKGLRIIDISNPDSSFQVCLFPVSPGAKDIFVDGHYAYITTTSIYQGFKIIDISDPNIPKEVGFVQFEDGTEQDIYHEDGIFVKYDLIYLANREDGLYIFRNDLVTNNKEKKMEIFSYSLEQNYPNPFNPRTTINYSIHKTEFVQLFVYDVLGRVVAKLFNKEQSAGNYKIEFDGSNLSSGIYYYQIVTKSFIETKKMILLR